MGVTSPKGGKHPTRLADSVERGRKKKETNTKPPSEIHSTSYVVTNQQSTNCLHPFQGLQSFTDLPSGFTDLAEVALSL